MSETFKDIIKRWLKNEILTDEPLSNEDLKDIQGNLRLLREVLEQK